MKTLQAQRGITTYRLEIISTSLADVFTVQDGKVIVHQQFVGPRAQALAVIAWTKATGLVKQEGH